MWNMANSSVCDPAFFGLFFEQCNYPSFVMEFKVSWLCILLWDDPFFKIKKYIYTPLLLLIRIDFGSSLIHPHYRIPQPVSAGIIQQWFVFMVFTVWESFDRFAEVWRGAFVCLGYLFWRGSKTECTQRGGSPLINHAQFTENFKKTRSALKYLPLRNFAAHLYH